MTSSGIVSVCYSHRYTQLLEEGMVDESTRIIDRDEVVSLQMMNRSVSDIARKLGITKAELKSCMALERKLVVQDRDRAVSLLSPLPEAEIRRMEQAGSDPGSDVTPNSSATEQSGSGYGRVAIVSIVRDGDTSAPIRLGLMTSWCESEGVSYKVSMTSDLKLLESQEGFEDNGAVVVWSMDGVSEEDASSFSAWCGEHGIELLALGDDKVLWDGVFPEEDGNTIRTTYGNRGRWIDFCWDHQRNAQSSRISKKEGCATRFASLEDVMECSRLGIPVWAVAKAVGVSTEVMRAALESEGFLDSYEEECRLAVSGEASPDVADAIVEPEGTTEGPVEDIDSPQPVESLEEPVEAAVAVEDTVPEQRRPESEGDITEGLTVIRIEDSLITESGMESVLGTVRDGKEPDTNIWTRSGRGWIIRSHRAWLAFQDGKFAYCTGKESQIVDVDYTPVESDVAFDRDGLLFKEVGRLSLMLADRTSVGIPIVSDYPIRQKRWLA